MTHRLSLRRADSDLVDEFDALFAGEYVEFLERRGDRVPPWAWTNLLAHGTEDALRRAATTRQRTFFDVSVWRRARSYLAGEVLDAAERAGPLRSLQTAVLVPLELDLVAWAPRRWSSAGEWAIRVLQTLERYDRVASRTL